VKLGSEVSVPDNKGNSHNLLVLGRKWDTVRGEFFENVPTALPQLPLSNARPEWYFILTNRQKARWDV